MSFSSATATAHDIHARANTHLKAPERDNRDLGQHNQRRRVGATDRANVGDGVGAAGEVLATELALLAQCLEGLEVGGNLPHALVLSEWSVRAGGGGSGETRDDIERRR